MSRDPFSLLLEKESRLQEGARRTLGEHTGGVLLFVCLLLTAVLPLVVLELVNPFSEGFLLRTAYAVLTSTLAYILFIPEGSRAEWLANRALGEAKERLRSLSDTVRNGHLSAFSLFCKEASERNLAVRREALLAMAEADPRRSSRLRRRAARLRPSHLSPPRILAGEGADDLLPGGQRGRKTALRALLRPVAILFTSLLFSSVVILPGAAPDAATAVRILTGLFSVVMASFAGFRAGGEAAREELGRLEGRILFLSSFCEEVKISV